MLAQAGTTPGLAGWYLGAALAAIVVLAVVVVVVTILSSASAISRRAHETVQALDAAHRNTRALWDVTHVNRAAGRLLGNVQAARQALGG